MSEEMSVRLVLAPEWIKTESGLVVRIEDVLSFYVTVREGATWQVRANVEGGKSVVIVTGERDFAWDYLDKLYRAIGGVVVD